MLISLNELDREDETPSLKGRKPSPQNDMKKQQAPSDFYNKPLRSEKRVQERKNKYF